MAIRDKFRRAIRRSAPASSSASTSSSSTSSINASSATSASSASSPDTAKPSGYRLAMSRTFPWAAGSRGSRGRSDGKKESSSSAARRGQSPDPREKPFTETNLKYQQMFEPFTMTFGTTRSRSSFDDEAISPRTSRRNSLAAPDKRLEDIAAPGSA